MRTLLLIAFITSIGCSKPATAPQTANEAAKKPACSVETALKPGVPGSPGHLVPSQRNPNGDSELAILMRVMQSDMEAAREAMIAGKTPAPMLAKHQPLPCTWPADPAVRDGKFQALSEGYLSALESFERAEVKTRDDFELIVYGCQSCHENTCPGPISAIKKLSLPDKK